MGQQFLQLLGTVGSVTLLMLVVLLVVVAVGSVIYGYLTPAGPETPSRYADGPHRLFDCAILIASKNGSATMATTVSHAVANQVPVYVLSDGSDDDTVAVARAAGADVVEYRINRGKPTTLHTGCGDLDLLARYRFLTIIDDDTHLEPDFVAHSLEYFDGDTAIVVGRTCTLWPRSLRWNPFVAYRAFAYWFYQLAVRTPQSWANALNCISGSNSTYRTEVLREVLVANTPYIVDDTYWVLETHRRKLGRIRYGPRAWAWIQDPTNLKDFYKQNLRWLWGTNQGIVGHRIGSSLLRGRPTVFETLYTLLIAHWITYLVGLPVLIYLALTQGIGLVLVLLATRWLVFYGLLALAALRLRHLHLILFGPVLVAVDLLYRVIWLHSIAKTIRQPTVESCTWESPARVAS
jgi:cellulose synthase/poly-beta-1,6-N-acetylglucosamine synthase-like glycosyltransferase